MGPVGELAVTHAAHAEHEAEQFAVGIERARGETADVIDNVQERDGDDVGKIEPPHMALQVDGRLTLLDRAQRPNVDRRLRGTFESFRRRFGCGKSPARRRHH